MNGAAPVLSDPADEWYRVGPALEKLIKKNPTFGLTAKQVEDMCKYEDSVCLWTSNEGFVVTQFKDDEETGDRTLFLWVSASFDGGNVNLRRYLPFFDGVANHMKCKYIELWSTREGMGRYLAKHDFEEFYRSYRKTV